MFPFQSTDLNKDFDVPVADAVLRELLEFLYTDKVSEKTENKDIQFWSRFEKRLDLFFDTMKEYLTYSLFVPAAY